MSAWKFIQLAIYEVFDTLPFAALALLPFRAVTRSKQKLVSLIVLLYCMGIVRRLISVIVPTWDMYLDVIWVALYLSLYYFAVRQPVPKLLFILITVLNYASLCAILYSYVGSHFFPGQLSENPYCVRASLSAALCLLVTYPFMGYWFYGEVTALIAPSEHDYLWNNLWLVPATFCVIFYYSLYSAGSLINFASNTSNLVFSLVISAGSLFVLVLMLKFVKASTQIICLEVERRHLEIHALQYERLSERVEEARRARHDLRQSLNVLQVFLEKGDMANLCSYISHVCASVPPDAPIAYCRYPPLNALICYYCELAGRIGASFQAQVNYPEHACVKDTDVIVLFGNLLENAVEACGRQEEESRFIRLKVEPYGGSIVITMENSCKDELQRQRDKFHSSKRPGPGIGTSSVKRIAEKYGGLVKFQYKDMVFYTSVLLNPGGAKSGDKA